MGVNVGALELANITVVSPVLGVLPKVVKYESVIVSGGGLLQFVSAAVVLLAQIFLVPSEIP